MLTKPLRSNRHIKKLAVNFYLSIVTYAYASLLISLSKSIYSLSFVINLAFKLYYVLYKLVVIELRAKITDWDRNEANEPRTYPLQIFSTFS